jgi:hypothetical protein
MIQKPVNDHYLVLWKKRVLTFYREVFDIRSGMDFMDHKSANESDVRDYAKDMEDGPNPEDLHFDMTTGPDSVWNRRVLELLLEKLKEDNSDTLPARSDAYWIDLLAKRFINLRTSWNKGQRKMKPSGELETPEEVEDRLATSVAMDEVRSRKATRRNHVSSKIFYDHKV